MISRRLRTALGPLGLVAALVLMAGGTSRAAERNPADELLDRAREAVQRYEFRGTVRIWWRDGASGHDQTVAVSAVEGGFQVDGGRVLQDGGRAWMHSDRQWTTLWSDPRDTHAPNVSPKYQVARHDGPSVVGRPTRSLEVRRNGHPVEIISVDRETGLVLRRDRFDGSGAARLRMQFETLTDLGPRRGRMVAPEVGSDAPGRAMPVPASAVRSLSGGFVLVDARVMQPAGTQLRYSDGVFEASVFTQRGSLDWSALPSGGADVRYGSVRARRYRMPSGTVIVWQSARRTLTCVTDAAESDQAGIVLGLSRYDDTGWTRIVRFVVGPFSWT